MNLPVVIREEKAALKRPQSKRFANAGAPDAARQLLECGRFSAAFALEPETPIKLKPRRHDVLSLPHR
jgi:hypothetical protein